jgi:hypothetical protein
MTNIIEKNERYDMQLHIEKAFDVIEEHLPHNYVAEVQKKLGPEAKINDGVIRNIRNKLQKVTDNRLNVLNALVEVSLENKAQKDKLISNLQ